MAVSYRKIREQGRVAGQKEHRQITTMHFAVLLLANFIWLLLNDTARFKNITEARKGHTLNYYEINNTLNRYLYNCHYSIMAHAGVTLKAHWNVPHVICWEGSSLCYVVSWKSLPLALEGKMLEIRKVSVT